MSTEEDIKSQIARLTATINQHKSTASSSGYSGHAPSDRGRGGYRGYGYNNSHSSYNSHSGYNSGNRWMNNKYVRPGLETASTSIVSTSGDASSSKAPAAAVTGASTSSGTAAVTQTSTTSTTSVDGKKEVVIGGVAFESSARSLVRKDLPKPKPPASKPPSFAYARKAGHLIAASRTYKPKARRGRGRNMTLDNTRKSWSERNEMKKRKYLNKPCPRFTTTGTCTRGLTCMYQHDPAKIAVCWNYLQGNCTNTAETCNLSHEATPERTPVCLHFLNKGRCTRVGCLFPHVNLGKKEGVCRDFAVLGYCEKGWDCDKQHVRECPDFAENGTCRTKGCKLPHVIRATRGRKVAPTPTATVEPMGDPSSALPPGVVTDLGPSEEERAILFAEDGHMGDEFISLTFHESDESEEEESGDEEEADEEDDDANDDAESDEENEEGSSEEGGESSEMT
ncbi:CCCH zinc finger protein [Ephemerocybe angulata]|uniref:CCCH zinc finger protein n=1 Tax=Ephemerocybe angulata TaxID=980116 RepID=A0A8H6MA83_9AGAR|nr:CCCH zinc finger protein [Tulosesus angulatus]